MSGRPAFFILSAALAAFGTMNASEPTTTPLRVAVVGLEHTHVAGFLENLQRQSDARLVGIVETDQSLADKYATKFHLGRDLFFPTIDQLLAKTHPQALLVYTSIDKHRSVIEQAAKHGLPVMVEKPLATSLDDALAIRRIANEHHIPVLVNYETTWYASNRSVTTLVSAGKLGDIRRIVVHDGHPGPKEIGVPDEFLNWLTNPARNGAGALFDFGCYGADLATVWMNGQPPLTVTAVAHTNKPSVYPHVDDDATIILQYPAAQAVFMPSWNWPFNRKDSEIYGTGGSAITIGPDRVRVRYSGDEQEKDEAADPIPSPRDNSLRYLAAVVNKSISPGHDLSSLETNMVVMQILDAARESARTGRTIELKPLSP